MSASPSCRWSCGAQARGLCGRANGSAGRSTTCVDEIASSLRVGNEIQHDVHLDSPSQRFLSVADLGGGDPDFHRPAGFLQWREEGPLANEEAYSMT